MPMPTTTTTTPIVTTATTFITSVVRDRIKALPVLDTVDTMYVADRDDGPGTNGSCMY